ncbi:efflux RND transporter periplasmic adaptor subunit [Dysgonomonas sp. 520]|uniref:efflux RND transporter periplasmic adaptor subunit n=1 Tax=Dysgonomonas sp. 520 TaxID=2302931 RepID=UPI0013D5EFFB|nr:efflux RND transporter periplasmic adaptor subunit [Dysgonomonas sp. 520]NDW09849.1 efflux RND transporter periplasmic adaptor subunit [Dysgonomonas sp. 520]
MNFRILSVSFLSVLLLASCGGGSKMGFGEEDNTPQEYETIVLQEQNTQLESVYPATIKGQEDIEIRPRVDGFIKQIFVDEGSAVRRGQLLFTIDSPTTEQAVKTAEAAVNSANAQVNTAKTNVDRIRPLAEKGIVSSVQLQTAEDSYQTALASKAQAQASLDNARASRSWANVTSPVDGVVGTISYRQGSLVNNGNVLTTVANTSNVFAYFSLNEKELVSLLNSLDGSTQSEKIKNMPAVTLKLADGTIYEEKGKIETIAGLVNSATGSVNFRAEFPNRGGLLRSGFSGNLIIPRYMDNAIIIPQSVTKTQQDKYLAYKVQGDTMAVQTIISVLPTPDGKNYVVTDGLKAGDRIVSEGMVTMADGKKIRVKK